MITYIEELSDEEKEQLTGIIRTLLAQTFLLERKYDKKGSRFVFNKEYRICCRHLEFLQEYFQVAGMELKENTPTGVIYLVGEDAQALRLTKLATIYLLLLKLIYDEQMSQASTSVNIYTTLGELNERMGSFRLLKERPSPTEVRRTLTLLKKYQIIEILDALDELESESRLIIYPSISMVLFGDRVQELLQSFEEESDGNEDEPTAI